MVGYQVFLRGDVSTDHLVDLLSSLRPFEALDTVAADGVVGLRNGVLVELIREHGQADASAPLSQLPVLVQFTDSCGGERADVAARAFLWLLTNCCQVEEAWLLGAEGAPLRASRGLLTEVAVVTG